MVKKTVFIKPTYEGAGGTNRARRVIQLFESELIYLNDFRFLACPNKNVRSIFQESNTGLGVKDSSLSRMARQLATIRTFRKVSI